VSWRVNAERLVLAGWTRAILLQIAHPLVAAGVFDHSGFRSSPLAAAKRLHHTIRAMLALTFGDEVAHAQAIANIRAIHRRVNGRLTVPVGRFPAGTYYSAENPALVLWVHATLIESVLLLYDQVVKPLSTAEQDAYCVEAAPVAVALGAPAGEVPYTRAAMREYLDRVYRSGDIAVGPQARELAAAILRSPSILVAPAAWLNELVTVGLLPDQVRDQYGFRWTPGRARALRASLGTLKTLRRGLPERVALWREAR
jgi:uncharacterized protein (DUF2236 family)